MEKYLIIGKLFDDIKRHFIIGERLAARYPEYLECIQDKHVKDLSDLNKKYKRLIFWTQAPLMYSFHLNLVTLQKLNYVIIIRDEHSLSSFNSANNGFHYYKSHSSIKHYIPFITDFSVDNVINQDVPCLGFYMRAFLIPDSYLCFVNMIQNIKTKIKVYILGHDSYDFSAFKNVIEYKQTYDNKEFFRNITHFVYPQSRTFQDPFPHCLLEAVQSGKQIILPFIKGRYFKDGIDDIKDCTMWHDDLDLNIFYNNNECVITADRFEKFHRDLFENNFEYSFDRDKYKTFYDWIIGET